jgi:thiol-disulfide isomerase/thioredoxin
METNFEKTKRIVLSYPLSKGIYIKEVENILPGGVEQNVKIECRVTKKREFEILEFREALFDQLSEEISAEYATDYINNHFSHYLGPAEGEAFPELQVDTLDGQKLTLKHESGKVWLLDFWATWCQYCQEPMEDNIKMSTKLHSDARIIGISVEEDIDVWKEHVQKHQWDVVTQYLKPGVHKSLGLKSIPDIAILDKNGKIVYLGHPNHINVEESLNSLAQGKGLVQLTNANSEWITKDTEAKIAVVNVIADKLNETVLNNVAFYVSTKTTYSRHGTATKTTATFKGNVTQFENDSIRNLDLKGLYDPVYNLTILNLIDEDF